MKLTWMYSILALGVMTACAGEKDEPETGDTVEVPAAASVVINEFMASNSTTIPDELGAHPDWIELYNPTDTPVDLSGWWMADDKDDLFNWQIPDGVTLPANGFLLIWADNDEEEGSLHAGFSLDVSGEDIFLIGPDDEGNPIVDSIEDYAPQDTDVSLARTPDGSNAWEQDATPTPGTSNN